MKVTAARVRMAVRLSAGQAHDSTIVGSARLSVYYRVMLLSGRARDYRFVGSARGQPEVVIRVLHLFHILFLCTVNKHTVQRRAGWSPIRAPAGADT